MYRFRQFRLLLWKNFLLQWRRPVGTVFEILLPVVFVAILILARLALKPTDQCFANFESSVSVVTNIGHFQQDLRLRANDEKDGRTRNVKKVNLNEALIGYHPSTPALDRLMNSVSSLMNISVTNGNGMWQSEEDMAANVTESETKFYGGIVQWGVDHTVHSQAFVDIWWAGSIVQNAFLS